MCSGEEEEKACDEDQTKFKVERARRSMPREVTDTYMRKYREWGQSKEKADDECGVQVPYKHIKMPFWTADKGEMGWDVYGNSWKEYVWTWIWEEEYVTYHWPHPQGGGGEGWDRGVNGKYTDKTEQQTCWCFQDWERGNGGSPRQKQHNDKMPTYGCLVIYRLNVVM